MELETIRKSVMSMTKEEVAKVQGFCAQRIKDMKAVEQKKLDDETHAKVKDWRHGQAVKVMEHGYIHMFSDLGITMWKPEGTIHVYQPKKRVLWINMETEKGRKACRPFRLSEVRRYKVELMDQEPRPIE